MARIPYSSKTSIATRAFASVTLAVLILAGAHLTGVAVLFTAILLIAVACLIFAGQVVVLKIFLLGVVALLRSHGSSYVVCGHDIAAISMPDRKINATDR